MQRAMVPPIVNDKIFHNLLLVQPDGNLFSNFTFSSWAGKSSETSVALISLLCRMDIMMSDFHALFSQSLLRATPLHTWRPHQVGLPGQGQPGSSGERPWGSQPRPCLAALPSRRSRSANLVPPESSPARVPADTSALRPSRRPDAAAAPPECATRRGGAA